MPLTRRVPKRGFNSNNKKVYTLVNIETLNGFTAGSVVDIDALFANGLIKDVKNSQGLKVLGNGELNVALTVKAVKFSASAKAAIEKAGGSCVEA